MEFHAFLRPLSRTSFTWRQDGRIGGFVCGVKFVWDGFRYTNYFPLDENDISRLMENGHVQLEMTEVEIPQPLVEEEEAPVVEVEEPVRPEPEPPPVPVKTPAPPPPTISPEPIAPPVPPPVLALPPAPPKPRHVAPLILKPKPIPLSKLKKKGR